MFIYKSLGCLILCFCLQSPTVAPPHNIKPRPQHSSDKIRSHGYGREKVFVPILYFNLAYFQTEKIQIMKHILILHKDNPCKYKMQLFKLLFNVLNGKNLFKPTRPYVKHALPPHVKSWTNCD